MINKEILKKCRVKKYNLELVMESSKNYLVNKRISSPSCAINSIEEIFSLSTKAEEILIMICLNCKNDIVGAFEVSRGSINSSIVHPREVFKRALLLNSASILIAHNHPSGDVTPSKEDIKITERLLECGKILGIELFDHIIIGKDDEGNVKARSIREKGGIKSW